MGEYNKKKRDAIGSVVAFVLGLVLNALGVIIMTLREKHQSVKGGFPLESDDLFRYSIFSGIGALLNTIVLVVVF